MHFEERDIAGHRIYAGAIECTRGGYVAGVAVRRIGVQPNASDLVFLNDTLSGGHRFDEPQMALRHAFDVGHQVVRLATDASPVKPQNPVGQIATAGACSPLAA